MTAPLYRRGAQTLVASWEAYARAAGGTAAVHRSPGVAAAVFPDDPERGVYNNALLDRDLDSAARADALDAMEAAYAAAGVARFAAWAHESDAELRDDLERRGYAVDTTTRAMGMSVEDADLERPDLAVERCSWEEHTRAFGLPPDLLAGGDHRPFDVSVVRIDGRPVATAMAFDFDGDCGIYNVTTFEGFRGRGLATALTAVQIHAARERGCRTATLQATEMAEGVYAAVGFQDLGRIVEYARDDA